MPLMMSGCSLPDQVTAGRDRGPDARAGVVALEAGFAIVCTMTNMMKEAIEIMRELPKERQETIARAILDFASHDESVYHLTDEERREVRAGLAEISRGHVASDEEVRAVYERIGV